MPRHTFMLTLLRLPPLVLLIQVIPWTAWPWSGIALILASSLAACNCAIHGLTQSQTTRRTWALSEAGCAAAWCLQQVLGGLAVHPGGGLFFALLCTATACAQLKSNGTGIP